MGDRLFRQFEPRAVDVPSPFGNDLAAGIPDDQRQANLGQLELELVGIPDWKDRSVSRDHPVILFREEAQMRKIRLVQLSPSNGKKRKPIGVEEKSDPQGNLCSFTFQKQKRFGNRGETFPCRCG
jgi:hypothetical protein